MDRNGAEPPEDGSALRKLANRLAMPLDPYEGAAEARVLVGRIPEDLSEQLPLPEGTTLLGSVARSLPRGRRSVEIMLDAAHTADRLREDYRRQLLAAGWREEDDRPGRSGFNPRSRPLFFRAVHRFPRLRHALGMDRKSFPAPFRLGARGPKLMVMALDRQDAPTDVRLHLILGQRDPWLHYDDAWGAIPTLYPPPGVRGRPEIQSRGVLHPREAPNASAAGEAGSPTGPTLTPSFTRKPPPKPWPLTMHLNWKMPDGSGRTVARTTIRRGATGPSPTSKDTGPVRLALCASPVKGPSTVFRSTLRSRERRGSNPARRSLV